MYCLLYCVKCVMHCLSGHWHWFYETLKKLGEERLHHFTLHQTLQWPLAPLGTIFMKSPWHGWQLHIFYKTQHTFFGSFNPVLKNHTSFFYSHPPHSSDFSTSDLYCPGKYNMLVHKEHVILWHTRNTKDCLNSWPEFHFSPIFRHCTYIKYWKSSILHRQTVSLLL